MKTKIDQLQKGQSIRITVEDLFMVGMPDHEEDLTFDRLHCTRSDGRGKRHLIYVEEYELPVASLRASDSVEVLA